jgi:leader peptidase (prepilin peptidase)/N-methyltransferase
MSHLDYPALAILLVWLSITGGAIGSFLNVVVYRVPAGMSLVHPGSHCPLCGHPIRWYDNVPVLGWILLGGRCRDCHASISARYPLIEALTMAMFLVVAVFEWVVPGGGSPARSYPVPGGFVAPPLDRIDAAGLYAYHLFLLCTLLPVAMIEYDGKRLPWRLGVPALVVGVVGVCVWPHVHPVAACRNLQGWPAALADVGAGLALGVVGGLVGWLVVNQEARRGSLVASTLTGVFLGWQAVAVLLALSIVLHLAWAALRWLLPPLVRLPLTVWWTGTALIWILGWQRFVEQWPALAGR